MKVCIVGAGAIGGFIGARIAAAGTAAVSALARGATLAALTTHGWRLRDGGALLSAPVHAADDPRRLGVQDLVIVAVKGPALPALAPALMPLIGADTIVLPAMNGVPWWFPAGLPALAERPLESVDPSGRIANLIPSRHVVGCVVHVSASSAEPGLAVHHSGRRLILGEPAGPVSVRVERLVTLLSQAGFEVAASTRIRYDIWYKLWGNVTSNPISALTGATMDRVLDDDLLRSFCTAAMGEVAAVGARIGCGVDQTPEDRHAVTRRLGAFKTSMLQDVEAGRALELDSIVGAVCEIGRRVGVPTPTVDAIMGLTRLFARVRGLYPAA